MIRYLLCWMLILSGLFALPVLLIRAQPYDDSELRAFLTPPEGCPAPCFMGIRPGMTTAEEAITILESSQLFVHKPNHIDPDRIYFRLTNPHNLIVDTNSNFLITENNIVQKLEIQTNISLWELWAVYGQADWASRSYQMGSSNIYYTVGYSQDMVSVRFPVAVETRYSIPLQHVHWAKLTLVLGTDMRKHANMSPILWLFTKKEFPPMGENWPNN